MVATPVTGSTSFTGATISLVVPRIPAFVKRAVPQLGVFTPVPVPAANTKRLRSTSGSEVIVTDTETPPPSYAETLAPFFSRRFQRKTEEIPTTSLPNAKSSAQDERDEECIQWKYANQGVSLLGLATQESSGGPASPFTRQLYIHALTYLLRALPASLNDEEHTSLTAAIPSTLLPEPTYQEYNGLSPCEEFPEYSDNFTDHQSYPTPPSLLYRLASKATVQLFVALSIILPWIQLAATNLYYLNRRHRVTERLFNTTLSTADLARRAIWATSTTVLSLQDGRVAHLLEGLVSWTVQSLSGGVYDGVGEGMAVLGLRYSGADQRHYGQSAHPRRQHYQQGQHYRASPAMGYRGPPPHSRGHSRNASQQSNKGYDWQQPIAAAANSPSLGGHYPPPAQHQHQVRVRAGSLRVVASSSSSAAVSVGQGHAGGPSERTLRKARSHEVMRGGNGGAGSGGCYSPGGKGLRMRPGLRRVDESAGGGGYA